MSLYRLQDGNSYTFRMGAGTDGNNRPEIGRWMKISNNNALDMMIPQNSEAERNAVYANMGVGGVGASVNVVYGQYGVGSTLYNNTSNMATVSGFPCWGASGGTPAATYATPPLCPSGFNDQGVTNTRNAATSQTPGQTGVNHNDQPWMFYQYANYICPAGFVANISVRVCTV
tara:strand:+ start:319 stop:837 length:519 start_codon:yes stop_codon:yes gene_type:complete